MFTPLIFYLWNDQTPVNGGNKTCFAATLRQIGSTFLVGFIFLDSYGNPTDPAKPSIEVFFPDTTTFTAVPERVSQGVYTYPITTPFVGVYCYTFSAL